ncbi:DMT family transporter [Pantoea piersonii]|uniref:DMT family transporter n=1 Tax=Pantoea piersonii TaxID=2364647 RepID=UPI00289FEA9A|nr:DMT family transporter [Pantoea piersonii]
MALITGLQPVLTAKLVSVLQRKHLRPRKWFGIAVGFAGIYLVLSPGQHSFSLDPAAFGTVIIGVLGVTIGALYQRRAQGEGHIFANTFLQYVTLTVYMGFIGLLFESTSTQWSGFVE